MNVLFVSSVAAIVRDAPAALGLYGDALGLPLTRDAYPRTEELDGVRHFGLWPLADAAQSCFGTAEWPGDLPAPAASIEFDVDDVDAAAAELEAAGHRLVRPPGDEPWGQRVARVLTDDGLLIGLSFTPWMRQGGVAGGAS